VSAQVTDTPLSKISVRHRWRGIGFTDSTWHTLPSPPITWSPVRRFST